MCIRDSDNVSDITGISNAAPGIQLHNTRDRPVADLIHDSTKINAGGVIDLPGTADPGFFDVHLGGIVRENTTSDDHVILVERAVGFTARVEIQRHDRHVETRDDALAHLVEGRDSNQRAGTVRAVGAGLCGRIM